MDPNDDFRELLELFNAHGIEYVVVGALALAWYGHPRYTGDIDLFVKPDPDNAQKIIAALDQFGFGGLGITIEDFTTPDRVIQLGVPPGRVDLLTSLSGITWDQVSSGSVNGEYAGVPVRYIGKADYIRNKQTVGRHRDLADIEAISQDL